MYANLYYQQFYKLNNTYYNYKDKKRTMEDPKTFYLKQYTCYDHSNSVANKSTPLLEWTLQFQGNSCNIQQPLVNQIIDTQSDSQKLFILRWQSAVNQNTILYIQQFNSNFSKHISMNKKPDFLALQSNLIYIIGGADLYIIDLINFPACKKHYKLGTDIIHAIEPSISQSNIGQRGINIYSWNEINGYRKRFCSYNSFTQDEWWQNITKRILFQKAPRQYMNSYFKIIMPNVLGLIILQNKKQICLIELCTMSIIEQTCLSLTNWQLKRPNLSIIKYYFCSKQMGFDDSILISIGQKNRQTIQLFKFHVKFRNQVIEKYKQSLNLNVNQTIQLRNLAHADIIDWNYSVLQTFFTFSTQGSLIDYLLTEKGLIFYANKSHYIPVSSFISYNNPLHMHPILSLEHNIGYHFICDNEKYSQFQQLQKIKNTQNKYRMQEIAQEIRQIQKQLKDSILRPNRYSKNFILNTARVNQISQLNIYAIKPLQLLSSWLRDYQVCRILNFKGDIIISRINSFSFLLLINQDQYRSENLNGQIFYQLLNSSDYGQAIGGYQMSVSASNYSINFPQPKSQQVKQNWWAEIKNVQGLIFTYQKQDNRNTSNYRQKYFEQVYDKYLMNLLNKISNPDQMKIVDDSDFLVSKKILLLSRQLIENRVKDIIQFNYKIIKYLYDKTIVKNQKVGNLKQEKLLINYLSFLWNLLESSFKQNCNQNNDLIGLYINEQTDKTFRDITNHFTRSKKNGSNGGSEMEQYQNREGRNQNSYDSYNDRNNYYDENQEMKDDNHENEFILIDVQKQAWKIFSTMFKQIIIADTDRQILNERSISSNKSNININQFIKLLLQVQNGYIISNFEQTFLPYDLLDSQIYYSAEHAHYPLTPTLLSIYSLFITNQHVFYSLINSFVLGKFVAQKNQKKIQIYLNKFLSETLTSDKFKAEIKKIYRNISQAKRNNNILQNESQQRLSLQDYNFHNSSSSRMTQDEQYYDSSKGIIYLSKVLEPEMLEKYLKELDDDSLEIAFKPVVNAGLQRVHQTLSRKSAVGESYNRQQILVGEVFKYRAYVYRLKKFLEQVFENQSKINSNKTKLDKPMALGLLNRCLTSFENCRKYYQALYESSKQIKQTGHEQQKYPKENVRKKFENQQLFKQTDEKFIRKVICLMVGFQGCQGLYLYDNNKKQFGINESLQYSTSNRALATKALLNLLIQVLKDGQTEVKIISNLQSIAYYYLTKVIDEPNKNLHYLKQLSHYFSKQEMSRLISKNALLRLKYQHMPNNVDSCMELRGYFAYCPEMITLKPFLTLPVQQNKNTNQKIDPNKSNRNESKKITMISESKEIDEQFIYQSAPFRNAFIQTINRPQ